MKKILIPLLFVSTPVLAGPYDNDYTATDYKADIIMENARKPMPVYTPPMPETEHYYQFRTPEGDVSRGWMRRLD